MSKYLAIIEVKVQVPAGYRPRNKTYKGFSLIDNKNILPKVEGKAKDDLLRDLEGVNPGLSFKATTSSTLIKDPFYVDNKLIEEEKGGE